MKIFVGVLVAIVVIIVSVLLIKKAIIPAIKRKYLRFVREHSVAIKELKEINTKYSFSIINSLDEQHEYDNETFFNNISCKDYLIYQLQFKWRVALGEIKHAQSNAEKYNMYQEEVKEKCALGKYDIEIGKLNYKKLFEIEKKEIQIYLQKPTTEFKIQIRLYKTDLHNRYHYDGKSETFDENSIKNIIRRLNNKTGSFYNDREIWDAICRVERGRVSNKMRFRIMERDGYRCRYCGRRGNGYNLEIDHIIPIAKGGKSTYDNLQTLCHDCNVKKGDSIMF